MDCEYDAERIINYTELIPDNIDETNRSVINDMIFENQEVTNRSVVSRSFMVDVDEDVTLFTEVISPNFEKEYPVILIRSPYSALSTGIQLFCAASLMAMYGYVVVVQDCRGTGSSKGEWIPFVNERNDGLLAIEWIKAQPWSQNRIAMFGPSYLSINQWLMADAVPVEVKTLFFTVAGTERYRQMYMGGMFRHEIYTMWAVENSGITTEKNPGDLYQEALKVKPHIEMDYNLFNTEISWYRDWVTNPSVDSDLWSSGLWYDLQKVPSKISIPVHMIAGWFDHHLDGMCEAYNNLPQSIRNKSRFLIGPWDHSFKTPGDKGFAGKIALSTFCVREAIEWFDFQLKGENYPHEVGNVETYLVNSGKWIAHDKWPVDAEQKCLYLDSENLVNNRIGILREVAPENTYTREFVYDSSNPVHTIGGSALLAWINPDFKGAKHGCVLQPEPEFRDDVVTFISKPFEEDIDLVGNIKVLLNVSSDAPDTCIAVKIMEEIQGQYFNICDGISTIRFRAGNGMAREYTPHDVTQLKIEMWPVAWKVSAGSTIRVDISSSNFPMYNIHRNHDEIWSLQEEDCITFNTLMYGGDYPSCILLPALI